MKNNFMNFDTTEEGYIEKFRTCLDVMNGGCQGEVIGRIGEARARSLVEWVRPGRGHWWNGGGQGEAIGGMGEARARSLVEWGRPGRGQ